MRRQVGVIVVALALAGGSCGGAGTSQVSDFSLDSAATYAETLDLSTPEAAVETFAAAFARGDFLTVWLTLGDPLRFTQTWNLQALDALVTADAVASIEPAGLLPDGIGRGEHWEGVGWHLFDLVMTAAAGGGYLIDLRGTTSIDGVTGAPAGARTPASRVVDARVEGIEGTVEFWMVESGDGDWRVYQVVAPGRAPDDPRDIWVAPPEGAGGLDAPPPIPEGPRNYYEALDLSSPESAVSLFTDAIGRTDYPTAFLVFDRIAQRDIEREVAYFRLERVVGAPEAAREQLADEMPGPADWEPDTSAWGAFNEAMQIAGTEGLLVVDLSGGVVVTGSTPGPAASDDRPTTDLTAAVAGTDGAIVFRMVQAPSGRWRVLQILSPGGDEALVPWSIPSG